MYRRNNFGFKRMVETTLAAQNTFLLRMENTMASFTNDAFPGTTMPHRPMMTNTSADLATNTVAEKVPRGFEVEISGYGTVQIS